MEYQGERITLRPITMADLADCIRWAAGEEVMHHVLQSTKTPEEELEWLSNVVNSSDERVL